MADQVTIRLYDDQATTNRIAIELLGSRTGSGADVILESLVIKLPGGSQERTPSPGPLRPGHDSSNIHR